MSSSMEIARKSFNTIVSMNVSGMSCGAACCGSSCGGDSGGESGGVMSSISDTSSCGGT